MDIGGQWLRNIPGVSPEGDIRIPYAANFVWRGCCQWGIESENYTVDRHGRSAVMLSVMKCSFGRALVRETRFSFPEERACVWVGRQEAYSIIEISCILGGLVMDGIGREIGMYNFNTAQFC